MLVNHITYASVRIDCLQKDAQANGNHWLPLVVVNYVVVTRCWWSQIIALILGNLFKVSKSWFVSLLENEECG